MINSYQLKTEPCVAEKRKEGKKRRKTLLEPRKAFSAPKAIYFSRESSNAHEQWECDIETSWFDGISAESCAADDDVKWLSSHLFTKKFQGEKFKFSFSFFSLTSAFSNKIKVSQSRCATNTTARTYFSGLSWAFLIMTAGCCGWNISNRLFLLCWRMHKHVCMYVCVKCKSIFIDASLMTLM